MVIWSHRDYTTNMSAQHRFPMGKYSALRELLRADPRFAGRMVEPHPIKLAHLLESHDQAYVEAVMTSTHNRDLEKRLGLPFSPALARRASLAASGTLQAALHALQHGFAMNAAGGSHHADVHGGRGFCTFNDVAVSVKVITKTQPNLRMVVLDLDVHQGDGTAQMLRELPNCFTISVHCEDNYPHPKTYSDFDIGLRRGSKDEVYLMAVEKALQHVISFQPHLVFYNAGVDIHKEDRLGHLHVTDQGLRAREDMVLSCLHHLGCPLVVVMGGGYGISTQDIALRHLVVFEQAQRIYWSNKA